MNDDTDDARRQRIIAAIERYEARQSRPRSHNRTRGPEPIGAILPRLWDELALRAGMTTSGTSEAA